MGPGRGAAREHGEWSLRLLSQGGQQSLLLIECLLQVRHCPGHFTHFTHSFLSTVKHGGLRKVW